MTVRVVSIRDASPQGYLGVDLKEVIAALGDSVQHYRWLIRQLDCVTPFGEDHPFDEVVHSKQFLSTDELVKVLSSIYQTVDAEILAIPLEKSGETCLNDEAASGFSSSPAVLLVMLIDSSFVLVASKVPAHIRELKDRFSVVLDEDESMVG